MVQDGSDFIIQNENVCRIRRRAIVDCFDNNDSEFSSAVQNAAKAVGVCVKYNEDQKKTLEAAARLFKRRIPAGRKREGYLNAYYNWSVEQASTCFEAFQTEVNALKEHVEKVEKEKHEALREKDVTEARLQNVTCLNSKLQRRLQSLKHRRKEYTISRDISLSPYSKSYKNRLKQRLKARAEQCGVSSPLQKEPEQSTSPLNASVLLDRTNISLRQYKEIAKVIPNTPKLHRVKKERRRLNSLINEGVVNDENGAHQTVEAILKLAVQRDYPADNPLRVKLSADGAPMGKFRSFTTYSITLVDEPQPAQGPHVVAVQEATESYENAAGVLERISREIDTLSKNGFMSKFGPCHVKFIFVADYKFMLIALGMKAANSQNACLYCEQKNVNYFAGGLPWRNKLGPSAPGCKKKNLLPCFSLEDTALDVMHMFFRVTDKLLDLVLKEEIGDDRDKIASFEAELAKLGIKNRLRANERQALEFCKLTSRDRECILDFLCDEPLAFLPADRAKKLQLLYIKYRQCYHLLKSSDDSDTIKVHTQTFMNMFCALYQKTFVTPYIHLMVHHAHELVSIHRCPLGVFNQQSVEKTNDVVKTVFFRCTNFTGGALQVIQRGNRVLHSKVNTT